MVLLSGNVGSASQPISALLSFWGIVTALTLVPATVAITFAETRGKRSLTYFTLAGAIIGLFWSLFPSMVLLAQLLGNSRSQLPQYESLQMVALLAILGGLGGAVYWMIAVCWTISAHRSTDGS